MSRETVVVLESKKKIEKIKKKYKNMKMSDESALKIQRLEMVNNVLKASSIAAGVITAIDFFVPDPVFGLDELALTGITALLSTSSSIVENKIDAIANEENANLKMDEITKLTELLGNVAKNVTKKGPTK